MTRVLVVDDEIDTLNLLRTILTISGYEAITTLNSTDAITLAEVEHPDCVLLDIMMPTLDGFTLCRMMRLHPLTMNLPIVFVTAYSALDLEERRLEAGADMVLPKPIGMDALVEAVEQSMKLHPPRAGAPAPKPAMPAPVQPKPATPTPAAAATPAPVAPPTPAPAAQPTPAKPVAAPSPAATTQSAPTVQPPAQTQTPPAATTPAPTPPAAPAQMPAPVGVAASKRTQQTKVVRPSVTPAPSAPASTPAPTPASSTSDDDLSFKISPDE